MQTQGSGSARRRGSSSRGTYVALAAVGLVVVIAIVVAMVLSNGTGGSDFDHSAYSVQVTGPSLDRFGSDPVNDPVRGIQAPFVTGTNFEGETVTITPDGRPIVILFLAHWCPHCRNEVDALTPWFKENGLPQDVRVVSIATSIDSGRPNYPPNDWLADWPVPVIVDDQGERIAASFGLNAFPYWVVLDGDGRVLRRFTGELGTSQWEQMLEALS